MRSRLFIPVLLAALLTACGDSSGDDEDTDATAQTSAPSQEPESNKPEAEESEADGESDDCRVSASKWADRMTDHVLDASTTAPVLGEKLEIEDLDDPTSEIEVLCSGAITEPVLDANANIAEINFELSLCAFDGECDGPTTRKVRRIAEETAPLVGQVRQLIGVA